MAKYKHRQHGFIVEAAENIAGSMAVLQGSIVTYMQKDQFNDRFEPVDRTPAPAEYTDDQAKPWSKGDIYDFMGFRQNNVVPEDKEKPRASAEDHSSAELPKPVAADPLLVGLGGGMQKLDAAPLEPKRNVDWGGTPAYMKLQEENEALRVALQHEKDETEVLTMALRKANENITVLEGVVRKADASIRELGEAAYLDGAQIRRLREDARKAGETIAFMEETAKQNEALFAEERKARIALKEQLTDQQDVSKQLRITVRKLDERLTLVRRSLDHG